MTNSAILIVFLSISGLFVLLALSIWNDLRERLDALEASNEAINGNMSTIISILNGVERNTSAAITKTESILSLIVTLQPPRPVYPPFTPEEISNMSESQKRRLVVRNEETNLGTPQQLTLLTPEQIEERNNQTAGTL